MPDGSNFLHDDSALGISDLMDGDIASKDWHLKPHNEVYRLRSAIARLRSAVAYLQGKFPKPNVSIAGVQSETVVIGDNHHLLVRGAGITEYSLILQVDALQKALAAAEERKKELEQGRQLLLEQAQKWQAEAEEQNKSAREMTQQARLAERQLAISQVENNALQADYFNSRKLLAELLGVLAVAYNAIVMADNKLDLEAQDDAKSFIHGARVLLDKYYEEDGEDDDDTE